MKRFVTMFRHCRAVVVAIMVAGLWLAASGAQSEAATKTLFERLGGKAAITAVVEDFTSRQLADKRLSKYYVKTDKAGWKGHLVDLICNASGGPCAYKGRAMEKAHARKYITEDQFKWTAGHLVATLNKFKVPKQEQDELVAIVVSLKGKIVGW